AGSRIQEVADRSLAHLRRAAHAVADGPFWSLLGSDVVARDRSQLSPSSGARKPECISPAEIVAAARSVLLQNLALSQEELVVETARAFGFARTGREIAIAIERAVRTRLQPEIETDHIGRLRLKRT